MIRKILILAVVGLGILDVRLGAQPAPPAAVPARDSVGRQIDGLRTAAEAQAAQLDSLRAELRAHRVQENFYENALGEQANRFGLIITGLLALAALVSWGSVRLEIQRVKAEFADTLRIHRQQQAAAEERLVRAETRSMRDHSNLQMLIAQHLKGSKRYAEGFVRALQSVTTRYQLYTSSPNERELRTIRTNIRIVLDLLLKLKQSDASRDKLWDELDQVAGWIRILQSAEDDELVDGVAKVRELLKKIRDERKPEQVSATV